MSIEANKQLVARFFGALFRNDVEEAMACLAPDLVWWAPTSDPAGWTSTREGVLKGIGRFNSIFRVPPRLAVTGIVAEGDRVAVEHTARGGITFGGKTYANDYHSVLRVRDGLICEVKEYMNPVMVGPILAEIEAARAQAASERGLYGSD